MVMFHQIKLLMLEFGFAINNFGVAAQPNVTTTITTGAWSDTESHGTLAPDTTIVMFIMQLNTCRLP